MNKMYKLIDQSGPTIKKVSLFCYLFFFLMTIGFLILGSLNFLSSATKLLEYTDSFKDACIEVLNCSLQDVLSSKHKDIIMSGYIGKNLCLASIGTICISFLSIPLYGFGCLIDDVSEIKKTLQHQNQ